MRRDDVVLIADGGDMTVGRRTAVYSYGNFQVILPEGREQQASDGRLQDGYISRPTSDRPRGRFDIGFVRADATIDLSSGTSDLESVIDTAQKRVQGDVFFERDISGRGLGRYRLGVDFEIGDIVQVQVWHKRLPSPVTSGDLVVSGSDGTRGQRVHVGGQMISDAESLRRHNDDLRQQIARDKRELQRQVGEVDKKADGAQAAAEGAQESTDGLTEDLTGDVDTPVPEAVEQRLGALGGIQRSVDQAQNEQLILHDNQLKWLRWTKTRFNFAFSRASGEAYNVADTVKTGLVDVLVNEVANRGVRWIVRPGWRGTYRIEASFTDGSNSAIHGRALGQANAFSTQAEMGKTVSRASVQVWPDHGVEPREWAVQVQRSAGGQPQFVAPGGLGADEISLSDEGLISFSVPVRADHDVLRLGALPLDSGQLIDRNVGVAPDRDETSGVVVFTEVLPQLQWDVGLPTTGSQTTQIASRVVPWTSRIGSWDYAVVGSWRAPQWDRPVRATITYAIRWAEVNAWALANYRTRIQVNGSTQTWMDGGTTGGMNTLFRQSVDVTLRPGDRVTIGAASTANATSQRRMSGDFTVSWRPL